LIQKSHNALTNAALILTQYDYSTAVGATEKLPWELLLSNEVVSEEEEGRLRK
jgi:hypothetical protein